ncbi:MAG: carbon-nitrogen hydrolase family protein [Bacteroidetes bacterium]|nr:carbon-nitrogen hydrolase family protein [Bacteroidota bacterium]
MKIAAAQIKPINKNTYANIQTHFSMIELAAQQNVELILFPEMSLTGYEREVAEELSFTENDARLSVLVEKAKQYQMYIIVGAPIKMESELFIGSFIFYPSGTIKIYTKQFLHDGEEINFSSSNKSNPLIEWQDEKISMAICADINHPIHAENASKQKTTLYLASIFYTPTGIDEAYNQLSVYAKKYAMNILMANYVGSSYSIAAAGKSAYWSKNGMLVSQLGSEEENLLIVEI